VSFKFPIGTQTVVCLRRLCPGQTPGTSVDQLFESRCPLTSENALRSSTCEFSNENVYWTSFSKPDRMGSASFMRPRHILLTLPTETTAENFCHCRPVCSSIHYFTYKESAPTALSAVCRAWREIAFATPILWSELDIWVDAFPDMQGHIERWFMHAGNCRLLLGLSAHRAEMVSHLREVIHRVEYIRLDLRHHDTIHLLRLDSVAFPLLKGATLHCTYGQDPSELPRNVFGNARYAPQLHDLHLLSYQVPTFTDVTPVAAVDKIRGIWRPWSYSHWPPTSLRCHSHLLATMVALL
jgi:hypothetical protein